MKTNIIFGVRLIKKVLVSRLKPRHKRLQNLLWEKETLQNIFYGSNILILGRGFFSYKKKSKYLNIYVMYFGQIFIKNREIPNKLNCLNFKYLE